MNLSPHSMARAAYEDAVAQMNGGPSYGGGGGDNHGQGGNNNEMTDRDKNNGNEAEHSNDSVLFGVTNKHNYVDNGNGEKVLRSRIEDIWSSDNGTTVDTKISATMKTIFNEIDSLVNSGLRAYNELESTTRQLNQSKELAETRSREVKRLHDQDEQSRTTLANLLRVVESSKQEACDSSRSAQVEARLRQNVNTLREERDKTITENDNLRRKLSLQEEELRLTKTKLGRVQQEKISIERDSRVAVSLARSLDNSTSNDCNYYKRKVNELSDKLQSAHEEIRQLRGQKKQRNLGIKGKGDNA